ncbi:MULTISPECIES: CBS domain-containing protein [Flavobacteriaceae]|uniref:CBS domain-containing protein n=1 Tax=Flavobacteriaceae TaxID=49546 RepID=UPI0010AEADAE|nr:MULTISPECIES: CBS domain-containing protein [Flavobacteriaceae]NJB35274.1 CBS domain-containing protein [Croceivirga sp. JEA036]TKD63514.1 CBS domain-containing protein [Flavobacterium sp. ASW18X]
MKKRVPVSEIMTRNVITLSTQDDLVTAEELFKKHHIRHIPVTEGEKVIGMMSYTDLMRISFADAIDEEEQDVDTMVYNMFTIEQVMVKDVISVQRSTTIRDVALFLSQKEFHALPVVDGDTLVGIVTTTDLINYLLEQY